MSIANTNAITKWVWHFKCMLCYWNAFFAFAFFVHRTAESNRFRKFCSSIAIVHQFPWHFQRVVLNGCQNFWVILLHVVGAGAGIGGARIGALVGPIKKFIQRCEEPAFVTMSSVACDSNLPVISLIAKIPSLMSNAMPSQMWGDVSQALLIVIASWTAPFSNQAATMPLPGQEKDIQTCTWSTIWETQTSITICSWISSDCSRSFCRQSITCIWIWTIPKLHQRLQYFFNQLAHSNSKTPTFQPKPILTNPTTQTLKTLTTLCWQSENQKQPPKKSQTDKRKKLPNSNFLVDA